MHAPLQNQMASKTQAFPHFLLLCHPQPCPSPAAPPLPLLELAQEAQELPAQSRVVAESGGGGEEQIVSKLELPCATWLSRKALHLWKLPC